MLVFEFTGTTHMLVLQATPFGHTAADKLLPGQNVALAIQSDSWSSWITSIAME